MLDLARRHTSSTCAAFVTWRGMSPTRTASQRGGGELPAARLAHQPDARWHVCSRWRARSGDRRLSQNGVGDVGQAPGARRRADSLQRMHDAWGEIVNHALGQGALPRRHGVKPHINMTTTLEA